MEIFNISEAQESFHRDGFVELVNVIDREELDFYYAKAMENFDEVIAIIKQKEMRFEIGNDIILCIKYLILLIECLYFTLIIMKYYYSIFPSDRNQNWIQRDRPETPQQV